MTSNILRIAAVALTIACAPGKPEAIVYDADVCAYCRMQISDNRFAAALVTDKDRTLKFDSIDCLLAYYKEKLGAHGAASMWVSDFRNPGAMLGARTARFVDLGPARAPMGRRGWAAIASVQDAAALGVRDTLAVKRWSDLP